MTMQDVSCLRHAWTAGVTLTSTTASVSDQIDWLGLRNRVCVVTGAAGGIGAEIARQLLSAGARVALLDRPAQAAQQQQQQQ